MLGTTAVFEAGTYPGNATMTSLWARFIEQSTARSQRAPSGGNVCWSGSFVSHSHALAECRAVLHEPRAAHHPQPRVEDRVEVLGARPVVGHRRPATLRLVSHEHGNAGKSRGSDRKVRREK